MASASQVPILHVLPLVGFLQAQWSMCFFSGCFCTACHPDPRREERRGELFEKQLGCFTRMVTPETLTHTHTHAKYETHTNVQAHTRTCKHTCEHTQALARRPHLYTYTHHIDTQAHGRVHVHSNTCKDTNTHMKEHIQTHANVHG